jgi:hypothetical protein
MWMDILTCLHQQHWFGCFWTFQSTCTDFIVAVLSILGSQLAPLDRHFSSVATILARSNCPPMEWPVVLASVVRLLHDMTSYLRLSRKIHVPSCRGPDPIYPFYHKCIAPVWPVYAGAVYCLMVLLVRCTCRQDRMMQSVSIWPARRQYSATIIYVFSVKQWKKNLQCNTTFEFDWCLCCN